MSWPRSRSRSGCSPTSPVSSATSSAARPAASSAASRSSRSPAAARRGARRPRRSGGHRPRRGPAPPAGQCRPQRGGGVAERAGLGEAAAVGGPVGEHLGVELVRPDAQDVPGRLGGDDALRRTGGGQPPPQVGHAVADLLRSRLGRVVVPHGVDQPVHRHDAVGVEQQRRQHPLLAGPAQGQPPGARRDLQRPQDPKLHRNPPRAVRRMAAQGPNTRRRGQRSSGPWRADTGRSWCGWRR
jgi:hypothetical protein